MNSALSFLIVTVMVLAGRQAAAEIPLAKANGWDVSLDGRLNTFASFSQGSVQPTAVPTWAGGVEDRAAGTNEISMTRIRSGFVSNVLGLTLIKQLSADLKVTGRFAIWVGVSQERNKSDNPTLDAREVYIKMEGPWGGVLAGRNLSLFERGAILLDYDIQHGFGLGHPCAVRTVRGAACGYAGHGLLFPSFNAGIVYSTPDLAGLQLSIGAYDPATISEPQYERTPYPRVEAELTYRFHNVFRAFADVLWQRIGSNVDPALTRMPVVSRAAPAGIWDRSRRAPRLMRDRVLACTCPWKIRPCSRTKWASCENPAALWRWPRSTSATPRLRAVGASPNS